MFAAELGDVDRSLNFLAASENQLRTAELGDAEAAENDRASAADSAMAKMDEVHCAFVQHWVATDSKNGLQEMPAFLNNITSKITISTPAMCSIIHVT